MKSKIKPILIMIIVSIILVIALDILVPLGEIADKCFVKIVPVAGLWGVRNTQFSPEKDFYIIKFVLIHIKEMREPSLYRFRSNKYATVYRVTKAGGVKDMSYSIRVDMNARLLFFKKIGLDRHLKYRKFRLSKKDIDLIRKRIPDNYWKEHLDGMLMPENGTETIVEQVENGKYFLVTRSMPEEVRIFEFDWIFRDLVESKTSDKDLLDVF